MDRSKRYENTLVAILFLTWGTVFLDRMSQLYLAPYIVPEFHLTHAQVGMLASVLAVTWAISTVFLAALLLKETAQVKSGNVQLQTVSAEPL